MIRKLCALGTIVLMAGCGNIDVRGFVRDDETGEPLPGATVRVGDDESQTDAGGFYEIEVDDDDEDQRKMYVSKQGYEASSASLEVDDDDNEIHKDLRLTRTDGNR